MSDPKPLPMRGAVAVIEQQGRFLVIQRGVNVRAGGAWCFPGGEIEPHESSAAAIVREVAEEIGLPCRSEELVWRSWNQAGSLVLDWWRVSPAHFNTVANAKEVANVCWLTPDEIRQTEGVLPGLIQFLDHLART